MQDIRILFRLVAIFRLLNSCLADVQIVANFVATPAALLWVSPLHRLLTLFLHANLVRSNKSCISPTVSVSSVPLHTLSRLLRTVAASATFRSQAISLRINITSCIAFAKPHSRKLLLRLDQPFRNGVRDQAGAADQGLCRMSWVAAARLSLSTSSI